MERQPSAKEEESQELTRCGQKQFNFSSFRFDVNIRINARIFPTQYLSHIRSLHNSSSSSTYDNDDIATQDHKPHPECLPAQNRHIVSASLVVYALSISLHRPPLPRWQAVPPPADTAGGGGGGDSTGGAARTAHPPGGAGGATPTPRPQSVAVRTPPGLARSLPCPASPLSAAPRPCPPHPAAASRRAPHHIPALPCFSVPSRSSQPVTPHLSSASPRLSRRSPHRPASRIPHCPPPPAARRHIIIRGAPADRPALPVGAADVKPSRACRRAPPPPPRCRSRRGRHPGHAHPASSSCAFPLPRGCARHDSSATDSSVVAVAPPPVHSPACWLYGLVPPVSCPPPLLGESSPIPAEPARTKAAPPSRIAHRPPPPPPPPLSAAPPPRPAQLPLSARLPSPRSSSLPKPAPPSRNPPLSTPPLFVAPRDATPPSAVPRPSPPRLAPLFPALHDRRMLYVTFRLRRGCRRLPLPLDPWRQRQLCLQFLLCTFRSHLRRVDKTRS